MEEPLIKQVGHYQLLDVIGRGGMGVVYRAIDTSIGRTVAIKMMHGTYADDKDLLERFHREVRSTANLQHKNIVTVYALDNFEGFPYMVMEFLEGRSMAEMITSHISQPVVDKIGLVCQVCEGLQYAHERNIVHRDIKPANILVLKEGIAKIVDFGIARAGRSETLTRTGQIIGSIYYMSPEQISGGLVDSRTDIYSAGVMLFEFLTGELPFKAADGDTHATLLKILNDPIPSLNKYSREFPEELDELLRKAMAKNVEERFQTAEDFGYELSRLQDTIKRGMAREFLLQAKLAIGRKEWDLARQQLQEILKYERRNLEANELIQVVRQEIQREQKSVQIAQLRSQAQIALTGLHYEEALECIEMARRLDPDDKELIALSSSIKTQVEQARELAEALRRGQAALYAGDLGEAEIAVKKALEIEQSHTEARALEGLIHKELEERKRRVQLQGFVEEARREISGHNFLSALQSLKKAQEIDPSDSNIRELLSWASRGHEQEKFRSELQACTSEIGQLLSGDRYVEALEACRVALVRFPDQPSLLQLFQLASRQLDVITRRRTIDKTSAEARRLMDADQHDQAIRLLEETLISYRDEGNLETLLTIARSESERKQREKEDREKQQGAIVSSQDSVEQSTQRRQEVFDMLTAFQAALAQKLPVSQLSGMAERIASASVNQQLNAEQTAQSSALLAEFNFRRNKWKRDIEELKELHRSICKLKDHTQIASSAERARFIAEQHGNDEEIRGEYQEIRKFAEGFRLEREAISTRVAELLRAVQATQDLSTLARMQEQLQEATGSWLEDGFIRSLVQQAAAHIEEVKRHKESLLTELNHLIESVSTARSAGQIRLLQEQARMLVADFHDPDVDQATRQLENVVQTKLERLDQVISRLKEVAAQIATAKSMAEIDAGHAVAEQFSSEDSEEAGELVKRIRYSVDERKKEYRRISTNLEMLVTSASKATGVAELDLILARRRDLLKKFPEDANFGGLESKLDTTITDRRAYLAESASTEAAQFEDVPELEPLDVNTSPSPTPATDRIGPSTQIQPKPRSTVRRFMIPAIALVCVAGVGIILILPKRMPIQTLPRDANITVDGQPCASPCTLSLRAGTHDVEAQMAGFNPLHQTIRVPWFGTEIPVLALSQVTSQPVVPAIVTEPPATVLKDARITVHTSIPGASVFVDNEPAPVGLTGSNRRYQLQTSAGSHRLYVEKSGFETAPPQTVDVAKNGTASLGFNLKPLPAGQVASHPEVSPSSIPAPAGGNPSSHAVATPQPPDTYIVVQAPAGAEIHIDQQVAGHSTGGPFRSKVQPGQRVVEVFLSGYKPWTETPNIAAGQTGELVANLTPVPASSSLPAPAPNASVSKSAATAAVSEEDHSQIQQLLDRYTSAIIHKDMKQLRAVWPDIPKDQLEIMKELGSKHKGVNISLTITHISLLEGKEDAVVKCKQVLQYDGQTSEDNVTFYMGKLSTGWIINQIPRSN
jgi:serine/threonine protein kinase